MSRRSVGVLALYTAVAIAATWPLATVINREIAWDMGDPLFNSWVLMWTGGQLLRFLSGDVTALQEFWHGNIFHPASLTVAYSEHLMPQMLQALPIWAATDNVVLAYNLLFLSTFALSGFGAHLLARTFTGSTAAAFVGGLAFAYAPYRVPQLSHLQVISSFWMPLALLGFRRYFETRRPRALAGGATALLLQNLSCGYYLLFFAPFVAAYCLYEMAHRRLLGDRGVWRALGIAAMAVAVLTWPFVSPYLDLRRSRGDVGVRPLHEVVQFSADVYSFGTASSALPRLHQRFNAFPKQEGEAFPGVTIGLLALVGLAAGTTRAWTRARPGDDRAWQRAALIAFGTLAAVSAGALAAMLVGGSLPILVEGRPWRETGPLIQTTMAAVILALAISPAARRAVFGGVPTGLGFFAASALVAAMLALGPVIESAGRPLGDGPYMWLYRYVPGFDGVRVPARFMMLVTMFLAMIAAFGIATMARRVGAIAGAGIALVAAVAILAEGAPAPLRTNVPVPAGVLNEAPRRIFPGPTAGPLYERLRTDPERVVLIEFPFGEPAWETQAVFYAGHHRRKLVNGYSGFFPEEYLRRATFLVGIPFDFDAATMALRSSGATHALVHEAAFPDQRGHEMSDWLVGLGAVEVGRYNQDRLFRLGGSGR